MIRARLALLTAASLLSLGALAGCTAPAAPATSAPPSPPPAASQANPGDAETLLAAHGLSGKSPREVVEALDQEPAARPLSLRASVRYDQVLLDDGTTQASLPLDGDDFYLSVAPYENGTHGCYFHNLGTCQGELNNSDVHVTVLSDDGETLVDRDATTYGNGFVGFWIPKDLRGTVTVTKDGKTGEAAFSSSKEGPTCLTTLRLK